LKATASRYKKAIAFNTQNVESCSCSSSDSDTFQNLKKDDRSEILRFLYPDAAKACENPPKTKICQKILDKIVEEHTKDLLTEFNRKEKLRR